MKRLIHSLSRALTVWQQEEVAAERRAKRAEAFVAPTETAAPSVNEKRRRKREKERTDETDGDEGDKSQRKKKRRKTADEGES
jgi:ribosomal RNA assembly protein